jgi:hypothetical protein
MESLDKVRKMLERFYQGESTLEEEKWLGDYFSSGSVPEELLPDRELFRTFGTADESAAVPGDLNRKILDIIDREEHKELRTRRISVFSLSGLAAGLLVLLAVYVFFLRTDRPQLMTGNTMEDTYQDPVEAYQQARQTLAYVADKLNSGTSELKHVEQVSKVATDPLKSLSKINKGSRELILLGQLQHVRDMEN